MRLVVGSIIRSAAANVPDRIAATLGERSITFAQLDRASCRTANALVGLGVGRGDMVAHWSGMSLRSLELFNATAMLGAPYVPLNPAFAEREAADAIDYMRARLIVADTAHAEVAVTIGRERGIPVAVVDADGGSVPGLDLDRLTGQASVDLGTLQGPEENDLHAIYLTSGSTGTPKGVMLSHRSSWLRCYPGGGTRTASAEHGGHVCMFPLFHWAGWHMATESWARRYAVHLVHRADAGEILASVERWRAGSLYCIPAVWNRILAEPPGADARSLRFADTGTSAIPPGMIDAIQGRFPGTVTHVGYGSTEGGAHTSLIDEQYPQRPASVGRATPLVTLELGAEDEIIVRSVALMEGYWDRPDETAAVLVNGGYHTGDVGVIDDEGFVTITGRKREIIRTGGEWVAPVEVEAALAGVAGVSEVAVVGVPDPLWGEVVCAVVVKDGSGGLVTTSTLRRHLTDRLAPHKHPRRVALLAELPRTPATGQVQRTLLRELIASGSLGYVDEGGESDG